MKLLRFSSFGQAAAVWLATAALLISAGARPASAFTSADADAAVNSYLSAFATPNGGGSFIKGDQNGGDPGFWQEVEEIEGIEDANDRKGGALNTQVSALLNGYSVNNAVDQKVRILPKTDGNFKFYFKHDDMSWDIPGGNTANNVNLQQYPDTANSWQEFGLERN